MIAETLKWLRGTFREGSEVVIPPGFLEPIDTDKIAQELKLAQVAADGGRRNTPPSESEVMDATEQAIVQRIESEWAMHGGALVNHLRAYTTRLISFSIDAEFERLRLKGEDAVTRLRAAHHIAEAELGELKQRFIDTRSEYEAFRSRHQLVRPPRDPQGRWTTLGLLFVLLAAESIFNGFFFAKGSNYGLMGGIGTAIGISMTNIALAFVTGLGPLRWLTYRSFFVKIIAGTASILGLALLLGLHGFAAHLRDATVVVGEEGAMEAAIKQVSTAPYILRDYSSYYLFVFGMLCASLAMWKGYKFDDPYPLYGAQSRRLDVARESYSETHSDLFDDLEVIKDETLSDIDGGLALIPKYPQQAAIIRAQRAALLESFRGYETSVETAANQLLAKYREINRAHRTDLAPGRFDSLWMLRHSYLQSAGVTGLITDEIRPPADIDMALEALRLLARTIGEEFEALIKKYPHTSGMH